MQQIQRGLKLGGAFALTCTLTVAAVAAQPWSHNKDTLAAQRAFQSVNPGVSIVEYDGAIDRIYGNAFSHGASPEHSAAAFLTDHATMLGVDAADLAPTGPFKNGAHTLSIMIDPATGQAKFTGVYYTQTHNGIPVFRSQLMLLARNDAGYPLVHASSSLHDLGDFQANVGPRNISAGGGGIRSAVNYEASLDDFSRPTLVIWAGFGDDIPARPTLAHVFTGSNGQPIDGTPPYRFLFVTDANSGAILFVESLIRFVDVTGNASGNATQGIEADFCEPEAIEGLPYARVTIGGTVAYADVNGDFVIPNGGSSNVTVESRVWGQWFRVYNNAGSDSVVSVNVTPPGPANLVHNTANTEQERAQVNAYIEANVMRDLALAYSPGFPGLTESPFPIYVNRNDGYCPGNAWYDQIEESLNFCLAGGGYPNTAWGGVIHHEYGHHLVSMGDPAAGGDYHEGMSDCVDICVNDDPGLGYGFFGTCGETLRTGDNTHQYPCSGGGHECGQLISGCVWSTREELVTSHPGEYLDVIRTLTINSILLHGGGDIRPSIYVDWLTLDDDDGNIGNGTPHFAGITAGFAAHNMTTAVTDCNNNGIIDQQDLDNCDGSPWCGDCNANGILDECDIDSGYSDDTNGNGIPDECECFGAPTIRVEILTDNYPTETTWILENQVTGVDIASGGPYAEDATLYTTVVCGEYGECYRFIIYDSYGDGICCSYGNGEYNVFLDGQLVATGGDFGASETVSNICPTGQTGACCYGDGTCVVLDEANCLANGGLWEGDGTDCSPNPCPQPELGACCYADGSCAVLTDAACVAGGGTWDGVGTDCNPNLCPQPEGACCYPDGSCDVVPDNTCAAGGGAWLGPNTSCVPNPCTQPQGACCYADGVCAVLTDADCAANGGTWEGMGTNCNPNLCPQPDGACCYPDGSCVVLTDAACVAGGGAWQGMGTDCNPNLCPQPGGACCYPDGSCAVDTEADCNSSGGAWQGMGTDCNPNLCPQPEGACCYPDGSCAVLTDADCAANGGSWLGDGTDCTPNLCPQPAGACCYPDGACAVITEAGCIAGGGTWNGMGTDCSPNPCPQPQGACCYADGSCAVTLGVDCAAGGGQWQGDGTGCTPNLCPQPQGACCYADGTCDDVAQNDCAAGGGAYQGDGTDCAGASCPQPGCPEDLDGLNGVGQGDLNAVLNRWGDPDCLPGGAQAPCPEDLDTLNGVGQGDLNAVLNRWGDPDCE